MRKPAFLSALILSLLVLLLPSAVFAEEGNSYTTNSGETVVVQKVPDNSVRVYDYADLLTQEEEASLTEQIAKTEQNRNCTVIVLTEPAGYIPMDFSYGTETSQYFAEQFYLDNNFPEDGWIFLIDMNNRVLWSAGHGRFYQQKYANYAQSTIYDDTLACARDGDYYGACRAFVKDIYKLDNTLYKLIPTPISIVISAVLTALTTLGLLGKHSKTQPVHNAKIAIRTLNYRQVQHNVVFLGKRTRTRHIERSSGSGGGGGGGGTMHSGGGFSGGGGGGGFSGGGGHF